MNSYSGTETILILLLITDILVLGSSRLRTCIRLAALQSVALGVLPLLLHNGEPLWALLIPSVGSMLLKGIVFPVLLLRIIRDSGTRREVEPFVGFTASIAVGIAAILFSLWISSRIGFDQESRETLGFMVPAGMATLLIGLFIIISRRKALSQVLGYLVMENGIFTFGIAVTRGVPLIVELGVLMDAFVAVFIMGIAAYHISREFDHINVDQLDRLKG